MGPLDDLAPLLQLTTSGSVIGLGEATHGTREAFQLKHRLIRALAERGGLRTVAFECGLAAGRLIDEYVRFGRGAAREALLRQGYWCWENREVLEFIEWLRQHNAPLDPAERVAFVGIDAQVIEPGLPEIEAALESCVEAHRVEAEDRGPGAHGLLEAVDVVRRLLAEELTRAAADAGSAARALMAAAPRLPTPELRALCRNAARYVDVYLNPEREDGLVMRDEYLAAAVQEARAERPGLMVVWAHNEHVAVNPDFFGARAMGHHLREALGERYLALGMLFGEGSFLARSWQERQVSEFRVGQAGVGHVERCLVGLPLGLFDSAELPSGPGIRYRRFLGSLYDQDVEAQRPDAFRIERPNADFDLIAWLPETTAARCL